MITLHTYAGSKHDNVIIRTIGQGEERHINYKRLKNGGGR
jgi:hypothetical protein